MKQNVKIFLIALIIGMVASYIFCYKFDDSMIAQAINAKATYLYVGSYNNLEAATAKKNNYKNALIYNDNGIYRIVIGAYTSRESLELMESFFLDQGINFQTKEVKVDSEFVRASENYELLIKSSDKTYYENINNSLLNLFNEYIN